MRDARPYSPVTVVVLVGGRNGIKIFLRRYYREGDIWNILRSDPFEFLARNHVERFNRPEYVQDFETGVEQETILCGYWWGSGMLKS